MSSFLIRVEMHERGFDYRLLHEEMARAGCTRRIIADDGSAYDLPAAEYMMITNGVGGAPRVRDQIDARLSARGWSFWLLVTDWNQAAWKLNPSTPVGALLASLGR